MHRMVQKIIATLLLSACIAWSGSVPAAANEETKPLVIQEQGSFAVGGTVLQNPGVYDPIKRTPAGQTFHCVPRMRLLPRLRPVCLNVPALRRSWLLLK